MPNTKINLAKYAITLLLATLAVNVQASGSFSVLYGKKSLDSNDWDPVDEQTEIGFGVTYQQAGWPLAMVISYLSSDDTYTETFLGETFKVKGETKEVGFGVRKNVTEDKAKFFIEGGLASISAKFSVSDSTDSISDSDSAMGFWFGAGLDMRVADAVSIGALVRMSNASVTLFDVDGEAGGTHFNIFAAYHF